MQKIGKYEILDKIGSGGFSVVYKGYDPYIKRPVAVKVCFSRDEEIRQRFFREAEIAGRMVHKNIIAVYDFGVHNEMPYLVEEYLPGEDLSHLIRRSEPKTLERKLFFLLQIASGLEYAHAQGVIHRDIKPSNVRVLDDGNLKIMDFGTAKLANVESHLTQAGMTLGTVAYLSPERLLGKACGLNSDIFSYGVLAYELLTFRRPFAGRTIPTLIDQVLNSEPTPIDDSWRECPEPLATIVHRCLEKDPDVRYGSCSELIADLETFRERHSIVFTGEQTATGQDPSSTAHSVLPVHLQLSGLLQRARQLVESGKAERASLLLEEVLDLDPDQAEAKQLLQEISPQSAIAANPKDDHRQRRVDDAVRSIENFVEQGDFRQVSEALRFAHQMLGPFSELQTLRRKIQDQLIETSDLIRKDARRQAQRNLGILQVLCDRRTLPLELAEHLLEGILELDPAELRARGPIEQWRREARQNEEPDRSQHRNRKQAEAVASIEQLLASGNPAMAERALRFAVDLLGDFEEAGDLQKRIAEARQR